MSIESMIIRKVMDELGISQEMVDKVKGIIDNIDIQRYGDKTAIEINMTAKRSGSTRQRTRNT